MFSDAGTAVPRRHSSGGLRKISDGDFLAQCRGRSEPRDEWPRQRRSVEVSRRSGADPGQVRGQRIPQNSQCGRKKRQKLGKGLRKTPDCHRRKLSGRRTARMAIFWDQCGARQASPSTLGCKYGDPAQGTWPHRTSLLQGSEISHRPILPNAPSKGRFEEDAAPNTWPASSIDCRSTKSQPRRVFLCT
jgi:hypothetical protein